MTPEQQRIAIAKACGWKFVKDNPDYEPYWEDPKGNMISKGGSQNRLPDYLNDLNAMHEAEKKLWEKDWTSRHDFVDKLARIISPTHGHHLQSAIDLLDATAAERAEAFLRTIGKWTTPTQTEQTKL